MDSPLTQQARPETFEPKVVGLYRRLFRVGEVGEGDHDESFWSTFFILKPDIAALQQILDHTDADSLLHLRHVPQQLFIQALARVKAGIAPADEHALDTLTVFFGRVLAKKFANPSSDVIEVLAGLDNVDSVFFDLVDSLDQVVKDGRSIEYRRKAVRTAIAVVSGGYQTAIVSYFVHRDLFPALIKLVHQLESPLHASEPFVLTGLLANYNKFESNNQYRVRLADFVNEETMTKVVESISWTTAVLRERYIAIQDDTPIGWSIGSTLAYVGLGSLAGAKQTAALVLTEDQQKELFAEQPGNEAALLLTLFDFVLANKLFAHHFVSLPAGEKEQAPAFANFLSFSSYLYQHAHRSARASMYAYLTLLILISLVEDATISKLLYETIAPVRLCRQRSPQLPLIKAERPYMAAMIDLVVDGINHNLRKRLDTKFYLQSLTVLSRMLSYLAKSRMRLAYHWAELWRSLLSFVRFLTTYVDELLHISRINQLAETLVELLTIALTSGEAFLPDAASYDDLFYKLVESGDALNRFRDVYRLGKPTDKSPINTLIGVSKHYEELIQERKSKIVHLTPVEVSNIIKHGYDTLSIESKEGLDNVEKFREADHKTELKKIARVAVADAADLSS